MKFEDWLYETDHTGLRLEHLYEDLADYQGDNVSIIIKWPEAAYNVGYEHRDSELMDDGK
jgi:hypothetical protein